MDIMPENNRSLDELTANMGVVDDAALLQLAKQYILMSITSKDTNKEFSRLKEMVMEECKKRGKLEIWLKARKAIIRK